MKVVNVPPGWVLDQHGIRPQTDAELAHAALWNTWYGRLRLWMFGCTMRRTPGQCYCNAGRW